MKTKVSFITMQCVQNYGSQLQTYATQEKLEEFFDEVEVIDYRRKDTYGRELSRLYTKGNPLKWLIIKPTFIKWAKVFGEFQKKFLNLTKNVYLDQSDFDKNPIESDALFTGSDQIWNTGWNNGIIEPYYLNFNNKTPKYAYSSSFGKNKLDKDEIHIVKERLEKFNKISVREESGKEIIEKQLGLKAVQIIDPTLIYNGDFWRKLKTKNKIKEKYILLYNLNRSKEFDSYARELSKKTGLPIYRFCTRYDQILRLGKSLLIPKIEEFITYIDDAEYVLTDSFHATAFSSNLHTEVIALYPEKYASRLSDFLKLVKNERAHPKNYQDFSVLESKTNFDIVDKILEKERLKANEFLSSIKSEVIHEK